MGRTTLIIAHRLTTVRNADLICAFENGSLKEQGTHESLMKLKGIYYELVTRQTLGKKYTETLENNDDELDEGIDSTDSESSEEDDGKEISNKVENTSHGNELLAQEEQKKKAMGPFYLEKALYKLQKPELMWNITGVVSQLINGAMFPALCLIFTQIYNVWLMKDKEQQTETALKYMGGIIGFGVLNFIVVFLYNYSFNYSGAKLTKRFE